MGGEQFGWNERSEVELLNPCYKLYDAGQIFIYEYNVL